MLSKNKKKLYPRTRKESFNSTPVQHVIFVIVFMLWYKKQNLYYFYGMKKKKNPTLWLHTNPYIYPCRRTPPYCDVPETKIHCFLF